MTAQQTDALAEADREALVAEWPLRRLISDVVGSGPKSATDMTREQALAAFEQVLSGTADPTTLGVFLLANRWKRNTPEELAAFVDVLRERAEIAAPDADPVDCGANYDGKTETALLGVAAGVVAAAAGTPVVVHSADRVPMSKGDAYRHVLDELGVATRLDPAASVRMVDEVGFGFYHQPQFVPEVTALLDRREKMGVRTAINTVETLVNPADAAVHLGSFYHLAFAHRIIDTVRDSRTLPVDRVLMLQGLEGYDDVRPGVAAFAEWDAQDGGEVRDRELDTADFGLPAEEDILAVEDVAGDSAARTRSVLAGERDDEIVDAVALNAGLRIYARRDADSLEAGVERARDAIVDGSAAETLSALEAFEP